MFRKLIVIKKYSIPSRSSSKYVLNFAKKSLAVREKRKTTHEQHKYNGPANVYLEVLGSGAGGVLSSFCIKCYKRYYFNCGEGFGRFAMEHHVKRSALTDIFLTSKNWSTTGGLSGLAYTLDQAGCAKITLHGPEGLDVLLKSMWFKSLRTTQIETAKCTPDEQYEDDNMTVKYVHLRPHKNMIETGAVPNDAVLNKGVATSKDKHIKVDENVKNGKELGTIMENVQTKSDCHMAYICKIKRRLGQLDLQKCVDRGVKPGPHLIQLQNGVDVVMPDGTRFLAKDVFTPDAPEIVIIVLDVPDVSYLRESEFAAHFDDGVNSPENIPAIVAHFTPPHVFNNIEYRKFISMFGPTTKHLVLNSHNSCLGSKSIRELQYKLNVLDPNIFPLLSEDSISLKFNDAEVNRNKESGEDVGDMDVTTDQLDVIEGRSLTRYHLRPKIQLDRSNEPKFDVQACVQEVMDVEGFADKLEQFHRLVSKTRNTNNIYKEDYPKVIFFGTTSVTATKDRSTSAIVLQINQDNSILLDCGEGTLTQLVRFFGRERANAFLRTLKAVYISHMHPDHHLGLLGILQGRRAAFQELSLPLPPLQLLAPQIITKWLSPYEQHIQKISDDYILTPNEKLLMSISNSELHSSVLRSMGVEHAVTCNVIHCPSSFGLALQIGQHKITYSGDTRPCEDLVKLGRDSTLLIHEATMEDDLVDNARQRGHSTTSQAVDVGRRMGAKYTILTHFSLRYQVLPCLEDRILRNNHNVGIAFDNMQVSMSDLELLPHMYSPLQLMFSEDCELIEKRAENRKKIKWEKWQ